MVVALPPGSGWTGGRVRILCVKPSLFYSLTVTTQRSPFRNSILITGALGYVGRCLLKTSSRTSLPFSLPSRRPWTKSLSLTLLLVGSQLNPTTLRFPKGSLLPDGSIFDAFLEFICCLLSQHIMFIEPITCPYMHDMHHLLFSL